MMHHLHLNERECLCLFNCTEGHVRTLSSTPAYSSQILLHTVSDSFVFQKGISSDIPLQRVFDKAAFSPSAGSSARDFK